MSFKKKLLVSKNHKCEYAVVTCMDFRFQAALVEWLNQYCGLNNYDRIAYAGAVKNWDLILGQLRISKRLHKIKTVILINHEDCGAYGEEGTFERHVHDLKSAESDLKALGLKVELYFAKLDGTIVSV